MEGIISVVFFQYLEKLMFFSIIRNKNADLCRDIVFIVKEVSSSGLYDFIQKNMRKNTVCFISLYSISKNMTIFKPFPVNLTTESR